MNRRIRKTSMKLLLLCRRLQHEMNRQDRIGITVLGIEQAQIEVINILLELHGVDRRDEGVAWLCEPIFNALEGNLGLKKCLNELLDRIRELKRLEAK